MSHHTDEAIRALVKSAAQAAIEYVLDLMRDGGHGRREVFENREQFADEIAEITMQCSDEDPDSEVHAVRALAGAR